MKVTWKSQAELQFLDFLQLLKQQNPSQKDIWYKKIQKQIQLLEQFSELGKENKGLNCREIVIFPFRIFYEINLSEKKIVILSFYHSRQNPH